MWSLSAWPTGKISLMKPFSDLVGFRFTLKLVSLMKRGDTKSWKFTQSDLSQSIFWAKRLTSMKLPIWPKIILELNLKRSSRMPLHLPWQKAIISWISPSNYKSRPGQSFQGLIFWRLLRKSHQASEWIKSTSKFMWEHHWSIMAKAIATSWKFWIKSPT